MQIKKRRDMPALQGLAKNKSTSAAYYATYPEKRQEHNATYRTKHPERMRAGRSAWRKKHLKDPLARAKMLAREATNNAIQQGKLIRLPCEKCGKSAEAHHDDYSKPMDVRWLCRSHHAALHRKERIRHE